jgi:hypothetical protein
MGSSTVTHIVAISSDNEKYLADIADDTFSIKVNKGWPYLLGFYNKTGSAITLLGYLKQNQVNWDSLPIMNPSGESTDLGTVEVNTASIEAIPSIDITSLISQMNMDLSTAQFYGSIDDPMVIFSNLDIDGNGVFDFTEDKAYLLDIKYVMGPGMSPVPGEIPKMLAGYNDDYRPNPSTYTMIFIGKEGKDGADKPPAGTTVTARFPCALTNNNGTSFDQVSSSATDLGQAWYAAFGGTTTPSVTITTPEVVPTGSYTFEVSGWGTGKFTFKNVQGSQVVKNGATEDIVYPVFNLVTDASGLITKVNYKWMIVKSGVIREATAGEVRAMVQDASPGASVFVEASPSVTFFKSYISGPAYMKKLGLDPGSIDVSDWNIKYSELEVVCGGYSLTSNILTTFNFGK